MRLVLGERVVMEHRGDRVLSLVVLAVSPNLFVNFLGVYVNLSGAFVDFVGAFRPQTYTVMAAHHVIYSFHNYDILFRRCGRRYVFLAFDSVFAYEDNGCHPPNLACVENTWCGKLSTEVELSPPSCSVSDPAVSGK